MSGSPSKGPATYPPTPYPPVRPSSLAPPAHPRPLAHPPSSSRPPSTLPQTLLRLARVLSLVLGSSAIIGLITSHFLLPLLQSSYEARRVLVRRQVERLEGLVDVLRRIRGGRMYSAGSDKVKEEEDGGVQETSAANKGNWKGKGKEQHPTSGGALFSPIRSLYGAQNELEKTLANQEPDTDTSLLPFNRHPPYVTSPSSSSQSIQSGPFEPLPLTPLSKLSTSLRSLSAALSATSTTRTSLLSTLEGYTSQLHRDLYLRSGPGTAIGGGGGGGSSWGSVGLGSLGDNLAKESGRGTSASGPGGLQGIGEEWDAVRKEVRAVKGLLLNRRNFAVIA